jgi:uncharacterized protein
VKARLRKKLSKRLMEAVLAEDAAAVTALLRAGLDPAAADGDGTTPLYFASVQGAAEIVRILLEAGAPPNTESGHGEEGLPLCAAACWGHDDAVRELLAGGADPNLREDQGAGHSPLEWAIRGGSTETADLLRAAGAQPTS